MLKKLCEGDAIPDIEKCRGSCEPQRPAATRNIRFHLQSSLVTRAS